MDFQLVSPFKPTGDQPQAIDALCEGLKKGAGHQVLLGVTGSGKTFTMASVIARMKRPALVISHNKTLAAQLYQEFRSFFPQNAICYFVSYYDYYQPEAYLPSTDTYIEKETEINEEIDKLRLAATTNLLTRQDTIIVASVSCIYNIGSPEEYGNFVLDLRLNMRLSRASIFTRLVSLQYNRSNFGFHRGTFRVRGDHLDIFPAYTDWAIRVYLNEDKITGLRKIDPLSGKTLEEMEAIIIYPAKHYLTDPKSHTEVFRRIRKDLARQVESFKNQGKTLEAHRLSQKVNYDLEIIEEMGYVNGIENYSRYFDGRAPGDPPFTLLDYFRKPYGKDWLVFIDESHITIPQIRGMYAGDRSRKQTLVDFGFRLPAALDNRPLTFEEFLRRVSQTIHVSATPDIWELSRAREIALRSCKSKGVVEQLVRPTGIVDPQILVRPTTGQIVDLVKEIIERKKKGERVLVTTLTKKMAEDLSAYLNEKKYQTLPEFSRLEDSECPRVHYLHSDVVTLERSDILDNLRLGKYDVLIGINLLREGLDLPEVSLVVILDSDKEGFLRSETSLIQTMGRAARHVSGMVLMYADVMTGSMKRAIAEIERRRNIQLVYNKEHHITPKQIYKPVREKLVEEKAGPEELQTLEFLNKQKMVEYRDLLKLDSNQLTPKDRTRFVKRLKSEMKLAADELNFELAIELRDKIRELKT